MWAFREGMASTAGSVVVIAGIGVVILACYGAKKLSERRMRVSSN